MFSFDRKLFLFFGQARREDDDKLDFKGGNVHIIKPKRAGIRRLQKQTEMGKP